jgi:HCOMODA/2-hydroxy-3-carboxy-muconic semialdehyde decarboxylase
VVAGNSIKQAVFRAIYTESNARLQAQAMQMGEPVYRSEEEARNSDETNSGQIERPWQLWKSKLSGDPQA